MTNARPHDVFTSNVEAGATIRDRGTLHTGQFILTFTLRREIHINPSSFFVKMGVWASKMFQYVMRGFEDDPANICLLGIDNAGMSRVTVASK